MLEGKNINELVRPRKIAPVLAKALSFIAKVQEPLNCTGPYAVVEVGLPAGFAAQFQMASALFMRAFAALDYKVPVLIVGHLIGYSDGQECAWAGNQWTCFFHPTSTCHTALLAQKPEMLVTPSSYKARDELTVPPEFAAQGLAFWWGAVQTHIFNVRGFVEDFFERRLEQMNDRRGFILGLPMAGIHVRHGDKSSDGFRLHSLAEELGWLPHSRDCVLKDAQQRCFVPADASVALLDVAVQRCKKGQAPLLRAADLASNSFSFNASQAPCIDARRSADAEMLLDELDSTRIRLLQH
eukprot:gene37167-45110_t